MTDPMTVSVDMGVGPNGDPAQIDLEELLATRLLVQGNSGSGKSHLLRRLLEESAGLVQQVVIDPEGDFVSLAEPFGHVVIDGAIDTVRRVLALRATARWGDVCPPSSQPWQVLSALLALLELARRGELRLAQLAPFASVLISRESASQAA